MKNKTTLGFAILIIAIIGLLVWARAASEPREITNQNFPGTDIACLVFGHQGLASHIHPVLAITVDGVAEPIPTDIGITDSCMSEVHTHDGSGQLHIESVTHGKTFSISDFFAVAGVPIEREGFTYQFLVNGSVVSPDEYTLTDLDQLEVRYRTLGATPTPLSTGSTEQDVNAVSGDSGMEFKLDI